MKHLITPADLAEMLGLAVQTIYNRRSAGASMPPCVRIGRVVRFPSSGVESWLTAQAEQPLQRATQSTRRRGGAA